MNTDNAKYIPVSRVIEVLDHMQARPKMFSSSPGSLWETYDALLKLIYLFNEESHNRYQALNSKMNYKYGNRTSIPFCHTEEVKGDFDLAVRFLKEFRAELEKQD